MNYDKIFKAAVERYGKDNVLIVPYSDLDYYTKLSYDGYTSSSSHKAGVIRILFPSIRIENEVGISHVITNLVVNIGMSSMILSHNCYGNTLNNEVTLNLCNGSRFSYDPEEIIREYNHSHLSKNDSDFSEEYRTNRNYTNFCMGNGHASQALIQKRIKNEIELITYFSELEAYLGWESLEGSPYRFISGVSSFTPLLPIIDTLSDTYIIELLFSLHLKGEINLYIDDSFNLEVSIDNTLIAADIAEEIREEVDWDFDSNIETSQIIIPLLPDGYKLVGVNITDNYIPFVANPPQKQVSLFDEPERQDWATIPHPLDPSKEIYYINFPKANSYEECKPGVFKLHPDVQKLWKKYRSRITENQARQEQIAAYRDERTTTPDCQSVSATDDPLFVY